VSLHRIPHEIVVVDDGSTDDTWDVLQRLTASIPELRPVKNSGPRGFGRAVVRGVDVAAGDAVVVMMADESDDCRDVVRYWEKLNEGYEAVFGSRFTAGGGVIDYPFPKYVLNRVFNCSFESCLVAISTTPRTRSRPTERQRSRVCAHFLHRTSISPSNCR
jgi:dolichol-phosphate mannosyltransferase